MKNTQYKKKSGWGLLCACVFEMDPSVGERQRVYQDVSEWVASNLGDSRNQGLALAPFLDCPVNVDNMSFPVYGVVRVTFGDELQNSLRQRFGVGSRIALEQAPTGTEVVLKIVIPKSFFVLSDDEDAGPRHRGRKSHASATLEWPLVLFFGQLVCGGLLYYRWSTGTLI